MCIRDRRGLEQAGIQIYPFDVKNLEGDKILIAGNAFRPDNNVEIAYADEHGLTYKRYHEFLGEFMRDFVSMGAVSYTHLQKQGKERSSLRLASSRSDSPIRRLSSLCWGFKPR